mmetsp:Transcript_19591/g.75145  ORF Transcript_19591/g.75145 Transcript_19591/m.75145 type:complete len:398 (+) Transcript_19591:2477-3670(+)
MPASQVRCRPAEATSPLLGPVCSLSRAHFARATAESSPADGRCFGSSAVGSGSLLSHSACGAASPCSTGGAPLSAGDAASWIGPAKLARVPSFLHSPSGAKPSEQSPEPTCGSVVPCPGGLRAGSAECTGRESARWAGTAVGLIEALATGPVRGLPIESLAGESRRPAGDPQTDVLTSAEREGSGGTCRTPGPPPACAWPLPACGAWPASPPERCRSDCRPPGAGCASAPLTSLSVGRAVIAAPCSPSRLGGRARPGNRTGPKAGLLLTGPAAGSAGGLDARAASRPARAPGHCGPEASGSSVVGGSAPSSTAGRRCSWSASLSPPRRLPAAGGLERGGRRRGEGVPLATGRCASGRAAGPASAPSQSESPVALSRSSSGSNTRTAPPGTSPDARRT